MESIRLIATLLPLAVSSGMNLYATLLATGLAIHYNYVTGYPQGLEVLGNWPVIIIAGIFFLIEFLADKIPYIDNIWDIIHSIIRPVGAGLLAFAAVGTVDPTLVIIAVIFSGTVAALAHSGKAGSRLVVNAFSPAENFSNTVLSTAEDLGAGILTILALKYPYAAAIIGVAILVVIIIFIPMMFRWAFYNLRALFVLVVSKARFIFTNQQKTVSLPTDHAALIFPEQVLICIECRSKNIKGCANRDGYLMDIGDRLVFSFKVRNQIKKWSIDKNTLTGVSVKNGWWIDTLFLYSRDQKGKNNCYSFNLLKDSSDPSQLLVASTIDYINFKNRSNPI